jgi:hypothetical protein
MQDFGQTSFGVCGQYHCKNIYGRMEAVTQDFGLTSFGVCGQHHCKNTMAGWKQVRKTLDRLALVSVDSTIVEQYGMMEAGTQDFGTLAWL